MKFHTDLYLLVVLILLAGVSVVSIPEATAQDIHVLMVIDNGNPKTGRRHSIDKSNIENLMKSSVASMLKKERPGATVKISELLSNDSQVTRENIFSWLSLQSLNLGTDDVVFVYFSGHGGADKTGAHERYLHIQDAEKLYHKEIAKAIKALNCRLKILITETDSVGPIITASVDSTGTNTSDDVGKPDNTGTHTPDDVSKTSNITEMDCFRQLFLEHEGFLNLTSTSLGHIAMGDNLIGGYFTVSLIEGILPDDASEVDHNPKDGFVSWKEVFELTKKYLNNLYQYQANLVNFSDRLKDRMQKTKQKTQVPEALGDFPKRIR